MLEHLKIIKPFPFPLFFCNKLKAWEISPADTNIRKSFGKLLFSSLASLAWGELWKGQENLSHEWPRLYWRVNLWIWGTMMLAWQGQEADCGNSPVLCQMRRATSSPLSCAWIPLLQEAPELCLILISKECKSFPRDLSWTAARSDDINCCAALGRDRSTLWVPGCLILPASLDPQAPVPWGWTDSAQQVRREQVSHAAFSAHNPQIIASALAHSLSPGKNGKCRTDSHEDIQSSHLACYLQISWSHGSPLQVLEFKKPGVTVCTIIFFWQ